MGEYADYRGWTPYQLQQMAASVGKTPEAFEKQQAAAAEWQSPSFLTKMIEQYAKTARAGEEAAANSPAWQKAVAEYNAGIPRSDPKFDSILSKLNSYYTDGAAAPGRLFPELAAQAIGQWKVDSAPSKFNAFMHKVVPPVLGAATLYAGGVGLLGGGAAGGG